MNSTKLTRSISLVALVALASLAVAALASAQSSPAVSVKARYPYDPACAWGRIANGKGMLVRCLSEQEAVARAGSRKGGSERERAHTVAARANQRP